MEAAMTMKIVRDLADGKLHVWSGGFAQRPTDNDDALTAVVFVHGILSSHERFGTCCNKLAETNRSWRFFYVDYDYHTPMEDNGRWLALTLRQHFRDKDNVIIVAHSMGGLVSRIACLSERLPFIRMLFLLATPNHGAIRTPCLTLLAAMTRDLVGVIWGLRPKKKGVFDLTRADEVMTPYVSDDNARSNVLNIGYVSIPGRYFHNSRPAVEHFTRGAWKAVFGGIDVGFELTRALLPLFSITLKRAHDGIVEEESNSLTPDISERKSEKGGQIRARGLDRSSPVYYAHIAPDEVIDCVHTEVPDNIFVIRLIEDIIRAGGLGAWVIHRQAQFPSLISYTDHGNIPQAH
jgi:hypothetical protein